MSDFREISHYIPISAEQHRMMTEGPTEAEQAEMRRRRAQWDAEERQLRDRYVRLRLAASGFERKVLDLHAPVEASHGWECAGCEADHYGMQPDWPCSTAELALNAEKAAPPAP